MPAPRRFWKRIEDAPRNVNDIRRGFLAHHTTSFFTAAKIVREGIISEKFAYRMKGVRTLPENQDIRHDAIWTYPVKSPLDTYEMQQKAFGDIRFLVSPNVKFHELNRTSGIYKVVKRRIKPSQIVAVIIPPTNPQATDVATFLEAAKEKGIPVYGTSGKRIWPKVKTFVPSIFKFGR